MKNKIIATALLIVSALMTGVAIAHSGGTDSNGCHNDYKRGSWHCH